VKEFLAKIWTEVGGLAYFLAHRVGYFATP